MPPSTKPPIDRARMLEALVRVTRREGIAGMQAMVDAAGILSDYGRELAIEAIAIVENDRRDV